MDLNSLNDIKWFIKTLVIAQYTEYWDFETKKNVMLSEFSKKKKNFLIPIYTN